MTSLPTSSPRWSLLILRGSMFHLAHNVATLLAFAYAHLSVSVIGLHPHQRQTNCSYNVSLLYPIDERLFVFRLFYSFPQGVARLLD